MVTVAVDGMGGDFGPSIPVQAAWRAAASGVSILLVGDPTVLEPLLAEAGRADPDQTEACRARIEIVAASQVIGMDASPAIAVRQNQDASVVVAARQIRQGRATAMISAGNSGAAMAAGLFEAKRIPGVERPALAGEFPGPSGPTVVLDLGANVDPTPKQLAQFAAMGASYARVLLERERPRVALLSNGTEPTKGTDLTRAAQIRLEASALDYVGYREGGALFEGCVDVIATDGFTGNIVLKTVERLADSSASRTWGAAPLLGLMHHCLVAHGAVSADALAAGIGLAAKLGVTDLADAIAADLAEWDLL